MFYGWGSDSERWTLDDGNTLVVIYRYVSLMFIFRFAYKRRWMIIGDSRSQDLEVSRTELERRYGADAPKPGVWSQYSLLIGFAALVVAMLVSSVM